MKIKTLASALILITGASLLSACADGRYQPRELDNHFGQTVNSIKYAQIADKEAAAHPPVNSPRKLDGYAGIGVISGYRQGFLQQAQQPPSVSINIGSGSSGSSSGGK
ncbi:hypothetical protein [Methylomicrobium lacus]|uniref:hypothetical protein n=1 Tax=Methylomicrobium lacus TaxID=136992 RepID=UPI0035A8D892